MNINPSPQDLEWLNDIFNEEDEDQPTAIPRPSKTQPLSQSDGRQLNLSGPPPQRPRSAISHQHRDTPGADAPFRRTTNGDSVTPPEQPRQGDGTIGTGDHVQDAAAMLLRLGAVEQRT